ncbi:hypothetical protein GQ600_10022 [Phytophthora cactorum]|nr:hypothetical protein GQ600_10022 [Phytophthora cactorum]
MDMVPRLLDYIGSYPRFEDANEFKDQLSGYTHKDLRAACSLLNLPVSKKTNKKGGCITTLVAYWKGDDIPIASKTPAKTVQPTATMSQPTASLPHHPMPMHEVSDVTQYVQQFPPHGDEQELRDQLNGCKAVILRSACVQLELRPNRKNFAKPNFVTLLVNYWKDSVAVSCNASVTPRAVHVPEPSVTPRNVREEVVEIKQKRTREEEKAPKKKKAKVMERSGDIFEEKVGAMTASLEKAKVVKEWASAIEILSRVDGSAESIASIRALIDGVVESAATDL